MRENKIQTALRMKLAERFIKYLLNYFVLKITARLQTNHNTILFWSVGGLIEKGGLGAKKRSAGLWVAGRLRLVWLVDASIGTVGVRPGIHEYQWL